MKIYFDVASEDHVVTFTSGEGWYTFKSVSQMQVELQMEYGADLELIELTPELYSAMYDAGDFVGYDPA